MNFNAVGSGAALSAYISSLLAKSASGTSSDTAAAAATPTTAAAKTAANAALSAASQRFGSTSAQHKLDQKQAALAADMRSAMSRAGISLSGAVEFSLAGDGSLKVDGSDEDKAAVTAFLKSDAGTPGFAARLTSLAAEAGALSTSIRQSAAISQAAKYAGRGGDVMSLYNSLLTQQDSTPAAFALSASTSSLTYPGVLSSEA
jgi:hypothetical protein